jgi:tetratricopeptide (TPR) repeat protein
MTDGKDISKAIREERYKDAAKLIRKALKTEPDSHWLWERLSTACYEQRQYGLSIRYAWKAVHIAPNCPLSLWSLAGSLEMYGRHNGKNLGFLDIAIKTYKVLLGMGWKKIVELEDCYETEFAAKGMLNDARYRLALIYWHQKDYKTALRWMNLHLRMRVKSSIYKKADILRDLKKLKQESENVKPR